MKSQIDDMNKLADAYEDGDSNAEINAIKKRMKKRREELKKLKLSKDEEKRLDEKYNDDFQKAFERLKAVAKEQKGKPKAGSSGSRFRK